MNIIDWSKKNGNPIPKWNEKMQTVSIIFRPVRIKSSQQNRPESRPESIKEKITRLLFEKPLSKSEIAKNLGYNKISGALKRTLKDMLKDEIIAYTNLDKLNSRLQKYKLLDNGLSEIATLFKIKKDLSLGPSQGLSGGPSR
ncbi:MAG: hypothetical protein KR126chlam6_00420 [Candidatus Anoxychlamydiales bacterium]|nr:hypothetical protein [Candidatus Anoxychlamydiales bacterium]